MVTYIIDPDYADRYVAFLDILGFSELTKKAHDDRDWRHFLRNLIAQIKKSIPSRNEKFNFRFINFSDSIVLSANMDREGLAVIIQSCLILSHNMLQRGILLRGGIAAGNLHHDDEIMFGPALLDAYEFEKRGGPPHIGLDPRVIEGMQLSLFDNDISYFKADDPWDLTPMLHTLCEFEHYDAIPKAGRVILDEPARQIADIIASHAADMGLPPKVRSKWRWMQDYWNRSVTVRGILPLAATLPPKWPKSPVKK